MASALLAGTAVLWLAGPARAADGDGGAGSPGPTAGGAGAGGFVGANGSNGLNGPFSNAGAGGGGGGGSGTTSGGNGGTGGVGGGGNAGGSAGAGGSGVGAAGGAGGTGAPAGSNQGGGGGGGGGGGTAGNGASGTIIGNALGGAGGAGGTGGASTGGSTNSPGGGGGGGGGGYGAIITTGVTNAFTVQGGAGGVGGTGGSSDVNFAANGGNGGTGGNAIEANATGLTITITGAGSVTAGNGGAGGTGGAYIGGGGSGGTGGNGGAGGIGIEAVGSTIVNAGSVTGGNGGARGSGGAGPFAGGNGAFGAGGVAIVGSDLTVINSGTIAGGFANAGTGAQANAIKFTSGANTLELQAGSSISGNVVDQTGFGTFRLGGAASSSFDVSQIGPSQHYQGFATFVKTGTSTWTLTGTTTATTSWSINQGTLAIASDTNLGDQSGSLAFGGGALQAAADVASARDVMLFAGGGTFDTNGHALTLSGPIGGSGGLTKSGAGTLTLTTTESYTGVTTIAAGTLVLIGAGSIAGSSGVTANGTFDISGTTAGASIKTLAGSGTVALGAQRLTLTNASTTFAGAIGGTGGVTLAGGTETLSGVNGYLGPTNINAGTLVVNGAIVSATAVNGGGTLAGIGTIGNAVTVNGGGTLAPGVGAPGTLTIAGHLGFNAGTFYVVQVNPSAASSASIGGSATLTGASVQTVFAPGSYLTKSYDILHATGGLGGTTFAGVSGNVPAGFRETLNYTSTDVVLNLVGQVGVGGGLNRNQQNVADALNGFFNGGGTLPPNFLTVFGLTGGNLATALTQLSGEAATGAQQSASQLMTDFLGVMLDPFVSGGGLPGAPGGSARAFAAERAALPDDVALAYAQAFKAPIAKAPIFAQRWSVWASGFGGQNSTRGDTAIGSHDLTARAGGGAAGVDYHLTRDTVLGFALAGGGTDWSLAQGLGGGHGDAFQAGLYGATRSGPWYLAGALAFANHWMSTDRFAAFGDHLTAKFDAQSLGGRFETGYRIATALGGIAPYAAVQAQSFRTPTYAESDLAAGGFGLTFNGRTATDSRGELGARFDHATMLSPTALLTLRGRLAWAHDWVSDPALVAVFQALPGASFVVSGATPAKDAALVTAGAELGFANGVTLAARFEGEFANGSQTYAGVGTLRYSW